MQAPMKARDLAEAKANARAEIAKFTVGLVSPLGHVTTHVCRPPGEGEDDGIFTGDVPVRWTNGEPNVWKPYREKGYRMLKEVCEADGVPERYDAWHQIITTQIMKPGLPIRGNVNDVYPPTVLRLRASASAGGTGDGQAFVIGVGITNDPELAVDALVGKLMSAGVPSPSADQIKGAKSRAVEASP